MSPGFIWTYARKKFLLREGTLMALATASTSELISNDGDPLIEVHKLKDLQVANQYISHLWSRIEKLTESDSGILFNRFDARFSEYENKVSMLCKEIQKMSLRIMDSNIQNAIRLYGITPENCYISLSGGYILNCPTNSYIMDKYRFKGFLAPPCVNDAGISFGIALYYFYKNINKVNFRFKNAFYGDRFNLTGSISSPEAFGNYIKASSELNAEQFVADIEKAPVIWYYGNAEIGPRALGHRSILADPRSAMSKDRLNDVKQRQWWRPVAPIVLADKINGWFEKDVYLSPFMLHTIKVREDKWEEVPAICHLDMTARLQTLEREDDPVLYDIISAFYQKTGIPIICNTSLNDAGEPIINNVEECLNFALRKRFPVIYINGKRIELRNHENYHLLEPLPRPIIFDSFSEEEKRTLKKKYNPFDLAKDVLIFRYLRPEIAHDFDITDRVVAEKLKKYAKISKRLLGDIPIPGI
jgi:predicted NodU family carbamoyl transferase